MRIFSEDVSSEVRVFFKDKHAGDDSVDEYT